MDEQFSKCIEVIWKLYINIPLLDAIQVPTYAKYLRDILNNKRPLPSTEVIKLTEECSAAILNILAGRLASPLLFIKFHSSPSHFTHPRTQRA
jgi:hypothetical protein